MVGQNGKLGFLSPPEIRYIIYSQFRPPKKMRMNHEKMMYAIAWGSILEVPSNPSSRFEHRARTMQAEPVLE
jgi:hypothetical protein